MNDDTKDKLALNVANAWKMWSNRATVLMGTLWTAYFALPAVCDAGVQCTSQHSVQAWFSTSLHIPLAAVATCATIATVIFRVWPQSGITPSVAAAKSDQ